MSALWMSYFAVAMSMEGVVNVATRRSVMEFSDIVLEDPRELRFEFELIFLFDYLIFLSFSFIALAS